MLLSHLTVIESSSTTSFIFSSRIHLPKLNKPSQYFQKIFWLFHQSNFIVYKIMRYYKTPQLSLCCFIFHFIHMPLRFLYKIEQFFDYHLFFSRLWQFVYTLMKFSNILFLPRKYLIDHYNILLYYEYLLRCFNCLCCFRCCSEYFKWL